MKRAPTAQEMLRLIERRRERNAQRKRPLWLCPDEPLALYVSPAIKQRLGLRQRTTVEYLEKRA